MTFFILNYFHSDTTDDSLNKASLSYVSNHMPPQPRTIFLGHFTNHTTHTNAPFFLPSIRQFSVSATPGSTKISLKPHTSGLQADFVFHARALDQTFVRPYQNQFVCNQPRTLANPDYIVNTGTLALPT